MRVIAKAIADRESEIEEHGLRLPELEPLLELGRPKMWFAVPGMYGGFQLPAGGRWRPPQARFRELVLRRWRVGPTPRNHARWEPTCRRRGFV